MKLICNKAKEGICDEDICVHSGPHNVVKACKATCPDFPDAECVPVMYIAS